MIGSEARYLSEFCDCLGIGYFRIDKPLEGTLSYANRTFSELFGFASPEDAVGRNVRESYVDPGERDETFAHFLSNPELLKTRRARFQVQRRRADNGEVFDVILRLRFDFDENGNICHFEGIADPVAQRRELDPAFREAQERFRRIFEDSPVGMALVSPAGAVTRVNAAFARFVGREEADIRGTAFLDTVHPDDRARAPLYSPDDQTSDEGAEAPTELRFILPCGGVVWGLVTPTRLREDSRLQNTVYMVQDITVRKRMEQGLLRMEKLESLAVLAGGIAHDFNNILTSILGNLSLADNGGGSEEAIRKHISVARAGTLRARELTQRLSTFARGGEPICKVANLAAVLREAADISLGTTSHTWSFEEDPSLSAVAFDGGQISQVFTNLLLNASEAMVGGGQIRIWVRNVEVGATDGLPLPPGRYVCATVSDEGVGIPEEHLGRIFDPYFSTKDSGSGLGLATSYSIVRKHKGHIAVETTLGRGTTFDVYLPASDHSATAEPKAPPNATARAVSGGRVLVMDDDAGVRGVAKHLLAHLGFHVDTVEDGAAALQAYGDAMAGGRRYDAVILDLTVPQGLGGAEIIGRLRQMDPEVRAVVSSGYSEAPVMANYLQHGFAGVMPKPYSLGELRLVIGRLLGGDSPTPE